MTAFHSITSLAPWKWELKECNQPDESYERALTYLIDEQAWLENHDIVRQVIYLLGQTKHPAPEKAHLIYRKLFSKNIVVKIDLPDHQVRWLPQENMLKSSLF